MEAAGELNWTCIGPAGGCGLRSGGGDTDRSTHESGPATKLEILRAEAAYLPK